jgi:predicted ATP-grasp superfamily ATP-dependent carboligase
MHKNLAQYPQHLPIILNASWINALGVIRSLALEHIPNISISREKFGLGLYSNQTIGLHRPHYRESPEALAAVLLDLSQQLKRPGILMPTDDLTLEALIRIDEQISPYFIKTYPSADLLDFILDKYNQYLSAKSAGVPVPFTLAPEKVSDLDDWPEQFFPCVVKGRRGKQFNTTTGFQAFLIHSRQELQDLYKATSQAGVIVQEYIPNGDDHLFGYSSNISASGELLGEFVSQKTQQIPKGMGVMRRGVGNSGAPVAAQSLAWLRSLGYTGFSYIEYKLDPRDGQYKLIELNARSWLNQFMATLSCVNFPAIIYHSCAGDPLPPLKKQADGVEWVSWMEDILYVLGDIIRGQFNFREWKASLPHGKDILFGWKDPLPAFIIPLYLFETYFRNRVKFKKLFNR